MTSVQLHYFAVLREQRGLASEVLSTPAVDAAALYAELSARHGFTLPVDRVRVAIDGEFASWNTPLREGAELVFIPPVAGG
ncbi:MAG TPA: MoaD/ThiS family protein [Opitutaceae bacterium]|jgi:molybdopterin synthase sulfur carrier subunit|nr:MoaD/ThiS family protein [Opitutaceae bacterium]HRE07017.1 MoaD/ThiS family protein [Opitutaceae bacterium]